MFTCDLGEKCDLRNDHDWYEPLTSTWDNFGVCVKGPDRFAVLDTGAAIHINPGRLLIIQRPKKGASFQNIKDNFVQFEFLYNIEFQSFLEGARLAVLISQPFDQPSSNTGLSSSSNSLYYYHPKV